MFHAIVSRLESWVMNNNHSQQLTPPTIDTTYLCLHLSAVSFNHYLFGINAVIALRHLCRSDSFTDSAVNNPPTPFRGL